jgi:hypothetical protein
MPIILESEVQRNLLLTVINMAQFQGEIVEQVADLKRALRSAIVETSEAKEERLSLVP